jgi:hypothetical protein
MHVACAPPVHGIGRAADALVHLQVMVLMLLCACTENHSSVTTHLTTGAKIEGMMQERLLTKCSSC